MGLASEMKNLTEELLSSFKNRIKENEELVIEVQKTLDGFRKDHQEMTNILNANASALRKGLAKGEKERLNSFNDLMSGIHQTIGSIQIEVSGIQASTIDMIKKFTADRGNMAAELDHFFAQGREGRVQDEKNRMKDFDDLMKNIHADIKGINDEVREIFKNTGDMLDRFDKEHLEMSDELRAELGQNLAERVDYTKKLLDGFRKRLADISKENQKMAQKLRTDLANGEMDRLQEYNTIIKGIQVAIKGIRTEVKTIAKSTAEMLDDLLQNRVDASEGWKKMQNIMAQIRKTGVVSNPKVAVKKAEKQEDKKEAPVKPEKTIPVETVRETPVKSAPKPVAPMTLEEKVLDYIKKHPKGVRISEMEEPLGETRMKLGFIAKGLLDQGKVQKMENIFYPIIEGK